MLSGDCTQIPDLAELVLFCVWQFYLLRFSEIDPPIYPIIVLSHRLWDLFNEEIMALRIPSLWHYGQIPPRPQPWTPPKFSGHPAPGKADGRAIERIGTEASWPWKNGGYIVPDSWDCGGFWGTHWWILMVKFMNPMVYYCWKRQNYWWPSNNSRNECKR